MHGLNCQEANSQTEQGRLCGQPLTCKTPGEAFDRAPPSSILRLPNERFGIWINGR